MIHLDPQAGVWLYCSKLEGKCELKYHAPFEENEVSYSLLMETYASEELHKEPDEIIGTSFRWIDADTGLPFREYGLPAIIRPSGFSWFWDVGPERSVVYTLKNKIWSTIPEDFPLGAKLYVASLNFSKI